MRRASFFVLVVVASIASVASASAAEQPYSRAMLEAVNLQASDVPAGFFVNQKPGRSLTWSTMPKAKGFEMCVDENGDKVFGTTPRNQSNSVVSLYQKASGNDIEATRDVKADIYAYSTRKRAVAAWKQLLADRSRCVAAFTKPIDLIGSKADAALVQTLGSSPKVAGIAGYTLAQGVAVTVGTSTYLEIWADSYTAYRSVGNAIIRAQFVDYGIGSLGRSTMQPKWSAFTAAEALRIAQRLQTAVAAG